MPVHACSLTKAGCRRGDEGPALRYTDNRSNTMLKAGAARRWRETTACFAALQSHKPRDALNAANARVTSLIVIIRSVNASGCGAAPPMLKHQHAAPRCWRTTHTTEAQSDDVACGFTLMAHVPWFSMYRTGPAVNGSSRRYFTTAATAAAAAVAATAARGCAATAASTSFSASIVTYDRALA